MGRWATAAVLLALPACGGSQAAKSSGVDSSLPPDAAADRPGDAAVDRAIDGGAAGSGNSDASPDVSVACAQVAPLRLLNPEIVDGSVAPGHSATIQVTLTDTGGPGYTMYPAVLLSSSTPGVNIPVPKAVTAAVLVNEDAFLKWRADFGANLQSGTEAGFTAEVRGAAGNLVCSTDDVLSFSLPVQ